MPLFSGARRESPRNSPLPVDDPSRDEVAVVGLSEPDVEVLPPAAIATPAQLEILRQQLDGADAAALLGWARQTFGDKLAVSSSFGVHSAVMLHLVQTYAPGTPILFIDTGYLFPETYRFAAELRQRLNLNLKVYSSNLSPAYQEALHGKLWEQGQEAIERYLWWNKVEPMQRALRELGTDAWLAGVRQDQTDHRKSLQVVDVQDGRYKLHPLLNWSVAKLEDYLRQHDLPLHPLYEQGYRSIGDWHSTLPTTADQDPREGRILGKKRECGLHLPLSEQQEASLKSSGL